MMGQRTIGVGLLGLAAWLAPVAGRAGTAEDETSAAIGRVRRSQLAIEMRRDETLTRFRATVLVKEADGLLILTAAHCLGTGDIGRSIRLKPQDGPSLGGRVTDVLRNPAYRPPPDAEIPGADNAVARLKVTTLDDEQADAWRALGVAELAPRTFPPPDGRAIPTCLIDQTGKVHQVRAGNFTNPRLLEWGRSFNPRPGDSGSGVFIIHRAGGGLHPLLIGVLAVRGERGGAAALVAREHHWITDFAAATGRPSGD
jgi:hypothetical protein